MGSELKGKTMKACDNCKTIGDVESTTIEITTASKILRAEAELCAKCISGIADEFGGQFTKIDRSGFGGTVVSEAYSVDTRDA